MQLKAEFERSRKQALTPTKHAFKLAQPPTIAQDPQLFMQPLKTNEVRRLSTNGSTVRETITVSNGGTSHQGNTGIPPDYRDFVNYQTGEEMLMLN